MANRVGGKPLVDPASRDFIRYREFATRQHSTPPAAKGEVMDEANKGDRIEAKDFASQKKVVFTSKPGSFKGGPFTVNAFTGSAEGSIENRSGDGPVRLKLVDSMHSLSDEQEVFNVVQMIANQHQRKSLLLNVENKSGKVVATLKTQ